MRLPDRSLKSCVSRAPAAKETRPHPSVVGLAMAISNKMFGFQDICFIRCHLSPTRSFLRPRQPEAGEEVPLAAALIQPARLAEYEM